MKRVAIVVVALGLLAAGLAAWYVWRPMELSVIGEKTDYTITDIPAFLAAFETDEEAANTTYLNKVVEVTGAVASIDTARRTVELGASELQVVLCSFHDAYKLHPLQAGDTVRIKGVVAGFTLTDVQLTQCAVLK
jgi:hypothetical protein